MLVRPFVPKGHGRGTIHPVAKATRNFPRELRASVKARDSKATSNPAPTREEVDRTLGCIRSIIHLNADLVPANNNQNLALDIWKLIRGVPAEDRIRLLKLIGSNEIFDLWRIASLYHAASPQERMAAIGPESLQDADFPTCYDDGVYVYEGKAALGVNLGFLDRFQKLFCVPKGSDKVVGRLDVLKGSLGRSLYPMYLDMDFGPGIRNDATGELASASLSYPDASNLPFDVEDLPGSGWPSPKNPFFPFESNLVDFLRPVGPGVWVGRGWVFPEDGTLGGKFICFLMVRSFPTDKAGKPE